MDPESYQISDHPTDKVQLEITGRFQTLEGQKSCFITDNADVDSIGELINACGYTVSSLLGRKITIRIDEEI